MTISSQNIKTAPFIGNSVATVFPFVFKCFAKQALRVPLTTIATGAVADLVLDSDYSVALNADQNANPGGSITYPIIGSPMTAANSLVIASNSDYLQETDLVNGGGWFPDVVEDALDKLDLLMLQLLDASSRSVRFPISEAIGAELPSSVSRALKYLAFDASGNPIAAAGSGGTPISAPMVPVVSALTLALARTAFGSGAVGDALFQAVTQAAARTILDTYSTAQTDAAIATAAILKTFVAAKGDLIGASANDTPVIIPVGADGTVLQADSSQSSGLIYRSKLVSMGLVVAAGTAVDFTGIPAWAKRITVLLNNVSISGTANILVQIGDSGGIETSGYLGSSAISQNAGATAAVNSTSGFPVEVASATNTVQGSMTIALLDAATFSWVAAHSYGLSNVAAAGYGGGSKATSAALDRIRITTTNGTDTFDAGSINVMYE